LIQSGVTTVQHIHITRAGPIGRVRGLAEQVIKAYEDIGMRVSYSYGYRDQCRLVYEHDEAFLKRVPQDVAAELREWFAMQAIPMDDQIGLFVDLWERYGRNQRERVSIQLAPTNLHWCSDESLRALQDIAQQYKVCVHLHLLESVFQKAYAQKRSGMTAVQHIGSLGMLGPHLTLGHAVWVTEKDLDLIAETGTRICHNASSNLRLRSGIAPCSHFLERGIPVAIGMDEATINDDRDMLQELRLVLRLHRTPGMDDAAPTAAQVFRMATEHGADTTGYAGRIGTIAPGMGADLVLLNWRDMVYPHMDADMPVIDVLVRRAKTAGVAAVMIAGEVVYEDGRFIRLDKDAVLEEFARAMSAPPSDGEQRRKRLAQKVAPFVRAFYDGYLDNIDREPYSRYRYNACR
jgi:5-methylthioadenosine/S-adenosylhomocysteine deaminase